MARLYSSEAMARVGMLIFGLTLLSIALYQNIILDLPYFYALFSLGMFLVLLSLYNTISAETLFSRWNPTSILFFSVVLLVTCIVIDHIGMALGYWEYPHYGYEDELRKYLLEWAVALLYHMVSLLLGIELFRRLNLSQSTVFFLAMVVVVTPVGFVTEALNIQVYSWRVLSMPITDLRIGDYYLVFQTVGYWTMALIPYGIYVLFDSMIKEGRE